MAVTITIGELGAELRRQRGDRPLKEIETEIGVSASTLSRIERGKRPDLKTVRHLADWLGVNVQAAGTDEGIETQEDLRRVVEVYLRASKDLTEEAARSIAEAVPIIMDWEIERWKKERKG